MMEGIAASLMDLWVIFGNCILWVGVTVLITWRLPISLAFKRLGSALAFDVYQMHQVRPLPLLATKDVLVIAGAMALMPLQALDAEFRWVNYQAGLAVGLPAAVVFFLLPIWGLRSNIKALRSTRLAQLESQLASTDREHIRELEALSAHIDRIRSMSNLPIDIRLAMRLIGYAVIAPLAWVGAALVEGLVEQVGF